MKTYNPGDESKWESDFHTDISECDSSDSNFSPWNLFSVI